MIERGHSRRMGDSFAHAVGSTKVGQASPYILILLMAITLTAVVQGQEWTRFRGPNGQ